MTFVLDAPALAPRPAADESPLAGGHGTAAVPDAPDVRGRTRTRPAFLAHAVMIALTAFALFPILWMVATSLTSPDRIAGGVVLGPGTSLGNYAAAWGAIDLGSMMVNSLIMSVTIALAQVLVAILAAYGFAMFTFPGKKLLYLLFVGSWLVPFQVTMIPNYVLIADLGLLNTVLGIIVPNLCSAFAVLMLVQHMSALPKELLESASIDGRTSWSTLWTVVVPNVTPAIASLTVVTFISAWNEYLWPVLVMQQDTSVVQVGIRSFLTAEGNDWGTLMAASSIACIPVVLLYALLQRQVVDGFVRSGLK